MRLINFGNKYHAAKFLYKKKFGSQKSSSKRLEIDVLTQHFKKKENKRNKKVEDENRKGKVKVDCTDTPCV